MAPVHREINHPDIIYELAPPSIWRERSFDFASLHPPGASRLVSNASPEDNGLAFTVAVSTRASWQLWPVCSAPSQLAGVIERGARDR